MRSPSKRKKCITLAVACTTLAACAPSDNALLQLAQQGKTQPQAPVQASSSIVIQAPAHHVWITLTDLQQWPRWNHDVQQVELTAPIQVGTSFTWTTGDTTIQSQLALLNTDQAVAWIGHASAAKAIHVITFQAIDASHTRVTSTESMDGPLLSLFYSSKELQESEDRLLKNLKVAAENTATHG